MTKLENLIKKQSVVLSLFALTFTAACSKSNQSFELKKLIKGDYFSMRQVNETQYIGLIQLSEKPLLSELEVKDGKTQISEDRKARLLEEQESVIAQLQEINPEIKIVTKYRLVLNAISFVASSKDAEKIAKIQGVAKVVENTNFERPKTSSTENIQKLASSLDKNSVTFIGADKLHKLGITGKGMRVGIIDTGIDYTHSMLGGPGKKEIYESIDPNSANEFFPNKKVVGGMDFVGSNYKPGVESIDAQTPVRDVNPLDEAEHGTHVGGTVAGIGDGTTSYSGVAPEADLFALKVFGKEGGTSDIAVISALEFSADPNEDLNIDDKLDVVNLSLGGGYGKPKILYSEAVKNLTNSGVVVVASAGNSGDNPYIVGAPSTSDEAISVAASIDDMDHNIISKAIEVKIGNQSKKIEELVEGNISIPASESKVSGSLVHIGTGATPIPDELKVAVKGKIALMDRGGISFADKLTIADSLGVVGVVMVNNTDAPPIPMGGEKKFSFPAVMITKKLGSEIKEALTKNEAVEFNFSTEEVIKHVEKIDQITDFSSRGPRSIDSLIKPEIAGPGYNVISAHAGTGNASVQFSGTSMSGPHLAGVLTLLKQAHPSLSVAELKALALNTAKILTKDNVHVPVSLQGAGRVQVFEAATTKVLALPATISLGEIPLASTKTIFKEITFKNISKEDVTFRSNVIKGKNITVNLPASFKVKAGASAKVKISFQLNRKAADQNNIEADGFVEFLSATNPKLTLPFLAVLNKLSHIETSELITHTDTATDKFDSEVTLTLTNKGKNAGDAMLFNLLGTDERKVAPQGSDRALSSRCDLEAAGVRIVTKESEGKEVKMLQFGIKMYDNLTMWQPCDISVQFDNNNDGVRDFELVGLRANYIPGIKFTGIASIYMDAVKAKELRANYEADTINNTENYMDAIIAAEEMKFYDHSSVAVIQVVLDAVTPSKTGDVKIKLAVTNFERDFDDDYLADHGTKWQKISLKEEAYAYRDIPELVTIAEGGIEQVSMRRGYGNERLLAIFPHNAQAVNQATKDLQTKILKDKILK